MKSTLSFIDLRKYQKDIIQNFEEKRCQGDRKFHIIAPPGSGKTLIGLELFLRLGGKALVLSPTLAIQDQWIRMAKTHTDIQTISGDPYSNDDLISLTYQSISVRDGEDLHKNSKEIIKALESRTVIIFDECHHLTKFWAKVAKSLDKKERYFVALTATYPSESNKKEIDSYLSLFESVDYEVLLPPVIKEGYLAPYNDLIYISSPTDAEMELIHERSQPYRSIMKALNEDPEIQSPHSWAYDRLNSFTDENGLVVPFTTLMKKRPDYCIAAARYVLKYGMELPYSVIFSSAMEDSPRFDDILLVLEDYINNYLKKNPHLAVYFQELINAVKGLGYLVTENGITVLNNGIKDILSNSRGKLLALKPVISQELMFMGDDFNSLVICDHDENNSVCSAREVFKTISMDNEINSCKPIMVTGKKILVCEPVLKDFIVSAEVFLQQEEYCLTLDTVPVEGGFEIISGNSQWNSRIWVPLVTNLLERGITQCLISTRSLLGEGWNAIRLNTLIDLTSVSSYAFVNQIRGRTLRLDEIRPLKMANNWDIISIMDDPEQGFYDLNRIRQKYTRFYGLSNDGLIEKGIGHVHPFLCYSDMEEIFKHRLDINREMLERASDRSYYYNKWNIHGEYSNTFSSCLDIEFLEKEDKIPILHFEKTMIDTFNDLSSIIISKYLLVVIPLMLFLSSLILRATEVAFIFLCFVFPVSIGVSSIKISDKTLCRRIMSRIRSKFKKITVQQNREYKQKTTNLLQIKKVKQKINDFKNLIYTIAQVIIDTLFETRMISGICYSEELKKSIIVTQRDENNFRIYCMDRILSPYIVKALNDIFQTIRNQKYFLCTHNYSEYSQEMIYSVYNSYNEYNKKKQRSFDNSYDMEKLLKNMYHGKIPMGYQTVIPVPEVFSKSRRTAELFQENWLRHCSHSYLISPYNETYRQDIFRSYSGKKTFPFNVLCKELWN